MARVVVRDSMTPFRQTTSIGRDNPNTNRIRVRDSVTPFNQDAAGAEEAQIQTQLLPDGSRQPAAEAWVLIFINSANTGAGAWNNKW